MVPCDSGIRPETDADLVVDFGRDDDERE